MLMDYTVARARLESLTGRQRDVLDLVVQHWTSKEIARELKISPNTVDQRVNAARDKLGAKDRADTARIYAELNAICGKTIYGPPVVANQPNISQIEHREGEIDPVFMLNDCAVSAQEEWEHINELELPRAKLADNRLWRLVAIVIIALGSAVLVTTILAVMQALNAMI